MPPTVLPCPFYDATPVRRHRICYTSSDIVLKHRQSRPASVSSPPDPGAAINALARLAHSKRRRGYQDRAA